MSTNTFLPLNTCDGQYQSPSGEYKREDGLAVRLTSFCDNRCPFCIASEGMKDHRRKNIPKVIEATLATPARRVLVIGGEPLLFLEDCLQFVAGVRASMDLIAFTTSLPVTVEKQWPLFEELMESIDSLNVSLQSTDPEENTRLMDSKRPFPGRMDLLERLVARWPEKITVFMNLVKGGLDSSQKVWEALDDLSERGVRAVKLTELQKAPESFVRFEDLFPEVSLPAPFSGGCNLPLENFYPGLSLRLKRSCFLVERSLGATVEDEEKLFYRQEHPETFSWQESNVIFEDGEASSYWKSFRGLDGTPVSNEGKKEAGGATIEALTQEATFPQETVSLGGCTSCPASSPPSGPTLLGLPSIRGLQGKERK